jgi:hypothetical protein
MSRSHKTSKDAKGTETGTVGGVHSVQADTFGKVRRTSILVVLVVVVCIQS